MRTFGLGLEAPEEDGVRQVGYDKDDVVFLLSESASPRRRVAWSGVMTYPSDRSDRNGRDLADHGVEGERCHRSP